MDVKLDQNIAALLYRYDCVIVPDFGGFIANYKPAKVNSATNTFSPPSKQISFNRQLVINDGLLTNYIAQKYDLTYSEALESVKNCVNSYKDDLDNGKHVILEDIGTLKKGQNQNIEFEPRNTMNFLSGAFGLEKFRMSPIAPVIEVNKPKVSYINTRRIAAAIAIPLAIGGLAYALFSGTINTGQKFQLSDFRWGSIEAFYSERTQPQFKDHDLAWIDSEVNEWVKAANENRIEEVKTIPQPQYFIVGGCFSKKSNAIRFQKKLQKKGYQAVLISNYKSMEAVAYGGFVTEEKARETLNIIKSTENKSAWLLKH